MSRAGKLVKDLIKSKRESVMGKLGDSPFEDPMEPWSVKYNSPVKEEILQEVSNLLQKYIRSLGYNPDIMNKSELMKYARSKEFSHYALDHSEMMRNEGIVLEAGTGLLMTYIKTKGVDPTLMDTNQKNLYSKSSEFRVFKRKHNMRKIKEISGMGERGDDWNEEKKPVKEAVDEKDTVTMDIPLLIRVLEYAREDAKTDMDLHRVVENLINMRGTVPLSMDHYDQIVSIKKVKESVEQIDELSKDTLTSYATKARTDAAKLYKQGDAASKRSSTKSLQTALDKFRKATKRNLRASDAETKARMKEEVEQVDEMPGANMDTRAVHQHMKKQGWKLSRTTGSHDVFTHPEAKHHIPIPRHRQLKAPLVKSILSQSRLREEFEELSELKKMPDNMDADDHITREDLRKWFSKTDPQGDWKRINSKGEVVGPCAREPGEPKPKCMSKEKRAKLSKSERAAAVAAKRRHDPDPERKGKPINVSNFGKGKISEENVDEACWDTHKQVGTKIKGGKVVPNCVPKNEEVEHLEEKNKPTNPSLWARAKAMARSKFDVYPSAYANGWASKWYKSKGGGWKSVKEETVSEGLGNKEDSPLSANDSVKAMESTHRNRQLRSARIIKSIYKNKVKKESLYDWEKDDKGGKTPNAKMILKGGKTMTGKDRDIVEIEPVLRTRPNNVGMNKPTV